MEKMDDASTGPLTALSIIPSIQHENLHSFVALAGTSIHHIQFVIKNLAQLLNCLHNLGLCHGGLSISHVIVGRHNDVRNKYNNLL